MTKDNLHTYATSRDRLISGIKKVAEVIKPTYGPAGGNVAMEVEFYPGHSVYNDGKKITDMIYLEDPVEQMGANMLKEACDKQERECGDGRKTTCLLVNAILTEGIKSNKKPLELKRELDAELPKIIAEIDKQKKEIPIDEIGNIAKIASESEEIGNLIGEIYPQIGREGIIEVESSNVPQTFYEVVDGTRLHGARKILDIVPYQSVSIVEDAKVLIVRDKIASKRQIESVYKKLKTREVVLYCDEIEQNVLASLAKTNIAALNGEDVIKTLVIKSPVMFKDWLFEDLEEMTGAIAIDSSLGATFEGFKEEWLGSVKTWKAEKDESRLNGTKDISAHIVAIEKAITEEKKEEYRPRLGWLNTKVAILKVGANSESELSWKIKKTIDASNASRLALKDGVVQGSGLAFGHGIRATSSDILKAALEAPSKCLVENNGGKLIEINETFLNTVLDPWIVIKSALTTAVSLSGIILTTKGALVVPEYYKELARQMQQRRQ
jgi:chaperonin GroEL